MFNRFAINAARGREDLSPYLVHVTRNNTNHFPKSGMDASHSFNQIWNERVIKARRVLCMHRERILEEDVDIQKKFKVACFTETPLSQIKRFIGVSRRDFRFEAYGFIFTKETMLVKGASPALYINQYGTDSLRPWADRIYEIAKRSNFTGLMWQGIPFMNSVHERNDFDWEREWKVRGNVSFSHRSLAGVILPENTAFKMRRRAEDNGVPVISASWGQDRIEETLANRPEKKVKVLISSK